LSLSGGFGCLNLDDNCSNIDGPVKSRISRGALREERDNILISFIVLIPLILLILSKYWGRYHEK